MAANFKININISPEQANTIFTALLTVAVSDNLEQLKRIKTLETNNPITVIVGAPKSGSTYLTNIIGNITDTQFYNVVNCQMQEHDLSLINLLLAQLDGCCDQTHMTGNLYNAILMEKFNIKPIILFRNIFDTVISLAKDLKRLQQHPNFIHGYGYSFLWNALSHKDLTIEELYDLVIDLALPWYIKTYAAWYDLQKDNLINSLWITYEELTNEPDIIVRKIIEFLNLNYKSSNMSSILSKHYSSSEYDHKGNEKTPLGYGIDILSNQQKDKINKLVTFYPTVNFNKIGITC